MYKVKLTTEERDAIRRGHVQTLIEILKRTDEVLVKELKRQRGDVSFQQGASYIVDELLKILSA